MVIEKIFAREILNSNGRPTIEATVITNKGIEGTSSVPSGTSKGKHEAREIYDDEARFRGFGVRKAIDNINQIIAPKLVGKEIIRQSEIDNFLIKLDGTEDKSKLGSNGMLAVSLAVSKAAASSLGIPLYKYLGGIIANRLPIPIATVLAGGKYSPSRLDFEDYMLIMSGFNKFSEALEALAETHYCLGNILKEKYEVIQDVGGAYAPPINNNIEAFEVMLNAIDQAGYSGKIFLGLDIAGNELYNKEGDYYKISGENISTDKLIHYYKEIVRQYPVVLIEDPFHDDDFESFSILTSELNETQIVGDDLFATNLSRIRQGIEKKACNTLLVKVNQIGTLTEACNAALFAKNNNYKLAVSMRSNDTNDSFIADLAVALGAFEIKCGSPVRSERNAKYNRLLKIELELGVDAHYFGN